MAKGTSYNTVQLLNFKYREICERESAYLKNDSLKLYIYVYTPKCSRRMYGTYVSCNSSALRVHDVHEIVFYSFFVIEALGLSK